VWPRRTHTCAEVHDALRRISSNAVTTQQVLALARDALCKGFPEGEILIQTTTGEAIPEVGDTQADPVPGSVRALAASVLTGEGPRYFPDTRRGQQPGTLALANEKVGSAVGLPCLGSDGPVASIVLWRRRCWRLTAGNLASLAGIAAHLGTILDAVARQAALERSYQELKESQGQHLSTERLAALGEMAAGVAHDFNNILATIMVRSELLRQVLPDPKWICHVEVIERVAHDGARTVRRLQEFTRPAKTANLRPVDLNAAIRDSLEITKSRWKDDAHLSSIHIEVQTELGDIPPVLGDASEIREVLTNLIVNAVDAMPKGGILRLATRNLPESSRVELTVADTGMGMTEAVRAQIFDPFFTTKGPGGSGLGLSVSYGILKRHSGTISVKTAPGEGTTFAVTLPAVEGTPVEEPEASVSVPGPLRILVIDDEEGIRVSLYAALQREGHFVAVAASGEEGLRLFGISKFDVVLTDLGMPGMSGWQVAQAVKRLRPRTPVVLITGWGATLSEADRHRPEADAILAKPVTAKAILQVLARLNADLRGTQGSRPQHPARGEEGSA
jgi:signal transduction histidine kinase/ActR/RegA family two-component response regulator